MQSQLFVLLGNGNPKATHKLMGFVIEISPILKWNLGLQIKLRTQPAHAVFWQNEKKLCLGPEAWEHHLQNRIHLILYLLHEFLPSN